MFRISAFPPLLNKLILNIFINFFVSFFVDEITLYKCYIFLNFAKKWSWIKIFDSIIVAQILFLISFWILISSYFLNSIIFSRITSHLLDCSNIFFQFSLMLYSFFIFIIWILLSKNYLWNSNLSLLSWFHSACSSQLRAKKFFSCFIFIFWRRCSIL